jgi:putative endopeptidase
MALVRSAGIIRTAILAGSLAAASAVLVSGTRRASAQGLSTDFIDALTNPGDDFYRYANGAWLRDSLASGRASYDNRMLLTERTSDRVRELIEQAGSQDASDAISRKVGAYYGSLVDEHGIAGQGLKPLAGELATISAIKDKSILSAYLGSTLNTECEGLTASRDHVLGMWVNQGFQDAKRNFPHLIEGGLGMAEREQYLDSSKEAAESRAKYQSHIRKMLKLAGVDDPNGKASRILSLEIQIAKAFAPDADAADVFKQNNLWKRAYFDAKAPGMDWKAYFKAAGLAGQTEFMVWQPSAVIGISALVTDQSLDTWKDYLEFHVIEHYASALPNPLFLERAEFLEESRDRKSAAIAATSGALGQMVGQLYARRYFPPEAKRKAQVMADDLIAAYRARIRNLKWMSAETKQKALAKLDALTIGVGYPDKWIDYSKLEVIPGDAFGNMRRAEAFNRSRSLAQLKEAADPKEWRIDPQVVGAVIVFSPNSEFFSAAILQPPYFDPEGDNAANYGSAGAGMAHEMAHSFDELGNIYDAEGRLGMWWTKDDAAGYRAVSAALEAQFAGYCPFRDLCVDGKRTLNENAADLAGLMVAYDAYRLSLKGKEDGVIAGFTGEQRFFLAFARRWRKTGSEASLRKQISSDSHAPGEYRSGTVRNVDAWYRAFQVQAGNKLYVEPEKRAAIW